MQVSITDLINKVLNNETASAANVELELWAGRNLIKSGDLEGAAEVINNVADHAQDATQKQEVANQLLVLAKAYGRQTANPDSAAKTESLLKKAATLAPAVAATALAQHLQKQKRLPEAIELWREAIKANPQDANHYFSLARAYEQSGQGEQALAVLLDLIAAAPSNKNYLIVAQRLDELAQKLPQTRPTQFIKIALIGNATLDHLQSYLKVECYRAGLRPQIYQGGFDQYNQDILNPQSDLYAFAPDVLICAIHASRLFPQLHQFPFDLKVEQRRAEMENGLATIQNLLDTFTSRSSAMVLFHNMVLPQHPALGTFDLRDELGQTAIFSEINLRLAELSRNRYKNVYIVDEDRVQARYGKANATDQRLWLTARMPWSEGVLLGLAKEYLRYLKPYKAMSRKCIVLDLDNTLWGGVIGEDGLSGIQLGADAPGNAFVAFQRELDRLWKRGILLAIASKNNPEDALSVFNEHPGMYLKLSQFAAQRINWEPKAANIREIAKELNIGLDSLVFLDDNPVERAKVRAELPQVLTPELPTDPAQYRNALLELDVFESLAMTEEDRNRNQLYVEQKARQEYEAKFSEGGSLDDYLANLEMVVEISFCNNLTLPRIAQLTGKTNQFNLTTHRYSEAQITEMIAKGSKVYGMRVTDRFGDNGLVGVSIVAPRDADTWEIDTLLLSCRVMGRGVETALLAYVTSQAKENNIKRLQGWYLPTAKNSAVKEIYPQHGFTLVERTPEGGELWELDVETANIVVPSWLTVRTPELVA